MSGIQLNYDAINQKGTPLLYTDTLANRPAYGIKGRVFFSTDTGQIFEDNGTSWSLLADAGVGGGSLETVTTNGNTTDKGIVITANGLSSNSVTIPTLITGSVLFSGTSNQLQQDNANLFWDDTNNRLGIGTNAPGAPLDIHNTVAGTTTVQINNTSSSNAYVAFQQNNVGYWRIGNTAAANSFDILNNSLANTPFSLNSSTNEFTLLGNVKINTSIAAGGRQLVVYSATNDTQIAAFGGAPSIRLFDNIVSPVYNTVFGLATSTNNFIAGSNAGDTAITWTNTGNLLFGLTTGAVEKARFTSAGNFLINTQSDVGYKLQVNGTSLISGAATFSSTVSSTGAYTNTSDLSFIASSNIPGINLRSTAGGRLSLLTGYIGANISSFLVGTGTNNPSVEILRIDHSTNLSTFTNPLALSNTVTASVSNVVTNKVAIVINGTQYYLLASTSSI